MSTAVAYPAAPPPQQSQRGGPTWEVALLFPTQGLWSEDEYLALDSNRMIELSDGCLEVLPMPTMLHQLIVKFLLNLLDAYVVARAAGTVFFAPLPVKLGPTRLREPDLVYLRKGRIRHTRGQPEGADLVMEVVSEGEENRKRDLVIKRTEYAQAGIAEYWIVDPEEQCIVVLTLDGQTYREHGKFALGTQATSVLLPGFSVSVEATFAAGQAG